MKIGPRMKPPATVSRSELLEGGSDRAFREFIHGFLAFAARLEGVRSRFGQIIGLSGVQYTILISVARLEGSGDTSVRRIAEHLHLSGAFVTSETNKLARMGLIEKPSDQNDQRRVRVMVTPKGHELLDKLAPVQRQANDVLFECLTAEQFAALRALMPKLVKSGDRALRLLDYLSE